MEVKNRHQKVLRWAIVGCGNVSQDFAKALKIADRNHHITVVGASSQEIANRFKEKLMLPNHTKTFGDHKSAILAYDDYDIAYIGVHASDHPQIVKMALAGKRHVLCERPLAPDSQRVGEIIENARRNECFLMEGYWCRFFPAWQRLKSNLKELGNVHLVQASLCYNKNESNSRSQSTFCAQSPSSRSINSMVSQNSPNFSNSSSFSTIIEPPDDEQQKSVIPTDSPQQPEQPQHQQQPTTNQQHQITENSLSPNSAMYPQGGHLTPVFSTSSINRLNMSALGEEGYHCSGIGYTVNFALWVFGGEMPHRITAAGKVDDRGNDVWGSMTLEFSEGRVAVLFYSTAQSCYSPAVVVGNNGTFVLPERFWCATELTEEYGNPRGTESRQTHKFPIRKDSHGFQYPNGNAFYLEADHVYDCIAQGKLESDVMSLEDSLKIATISDKIREKVFAASENSQ